MTWRWVGIALMLASGVGARSQWDVQDSHTKASLRGIHSLGNGVAWASGTGGTVLRTVDGGKNWQVCAVPPGAEKLDFRGVQGFDAATAIVMSSGKGDLSRLYKTVDGCQSWKLVFVNPDPEGFWDAVTASMTGPKAEQSCSMDHRRITGSIFGDPAVHKSNQWDTTDKRSFYLAKFEIDSACSKDALLPSASALFSAPGEAAYAASNSVLYQPGPQTFWMLAAHNLIQYEVGFSSPHNYPTFKVCPMQVSVRRGTASQGAFSFAIRPGSIQQEKVTKIFKPFQCQRADMVAVGGDYAAPTDIDGTAAFTAGTNRFQPAQTSPHGYRSAVAYEATARAWIAVGPNGTDVSSDDGRNWRALKPGAGEAADADRDWNALSLPFVVGPKGRIGVLRDGVLKK